MRLIGLILIWASALSPRVVSGASGRPALPFKLYRGYTIVVRASVGRLEKLNFIVDTGAVPSVIDKRIAGKLRLVGKADQLLVFSATLQAERVVLPDVLLGPIETGPQPVLVEDLSPFSQALGTPIDGMVGLDILGRRSFTLDYASKQITFGVAEPSDFAHAVPFEVNATGYVTVEAKVQGRFVRLMVDTGTADFVLFRTGGCDQMTGVRVLSQKSMANLGGGFKVLTAELTDATLGPLNLRGRHVSLMDVSPATPPDLDGLLGIRYLELTRLAFDFEHGIMFWERGRVDGEKSIERRDLRVESSFVSTTLDAHQPGP
jgi:hypothetical protein